MYREALVISVIAVIIQLIIINNGDVYMMLPFMRDMDLTKTQILLINTSFMTFVSVIISKFLPF